MTQSFDDLKKFAISDILSVSGKDKAVRVIENHMNNLIEISLIKGAASRQAEIDKLKADHHGAEIGRDCFLKQLKDRHKSEVYELKAELEALQGMHNAISLYAGELVDERDELQKRIDSIVNAIDKYKYSSGERILREIKDLLK